MVNIKDGKESHIRGTQAKNEGLAKAAKRIFCEKTAYALGKHLAETWKPKYPTAYYVSEQKLFSANKKDRKTYQSWAINSPVIGKLFDPNENDASKKISDDGKTATFAVYIPHKDENFHKKTATKINKNIKEHTPEKINFNQKKRNLNPVQWAAID